MTVSTVIPAKAGIHVITMHYPAETWIPAFAGLAPKRSILLAVGISPHFQHSVRALPDAATGAAVLLLEGLRQRDGLGKVAMLGGPLCAICGAGAAETSALVRLSCGKVCSSISGGSRERA